MTTTNNVLRRLVSNIGFILTARHQTVTVIESCTGGGVGFALTMVAGSSKWFKRGFIAYDNQAKIELVNVSEEIIQNYGAVSTQCAEAMAKGAKSAANAHYALAITGIAGPGGSTSYKPVGTVCFGWANPDETVLINEQNFSGTRDSIRAQAIHYALNGLLDRLNTEAEIPSLH